MGLYPGPVSYTHLDVYKRQELLRLMGIPIAELSGYEADDLLGTISARCRANGDDCIIATGDRDSLQLIGEHVQVCMVKTKENILYDIPKLKEDYGVSPEEVVELKALMGDADVYKRQPSIRGTGRRFSGLRRWIWNTISSEAM